MGEARAKRAPLVNQLALLLMGILIVYLVVDFGRQVIVSRHIQSELTSLERDIEQVQVVKASLEDRLAWAQSPAAAEAWAREHGMVLENEVPLAIVAPEAGASTSEEVLAQEQLDLKSARDAWWDLFFGGQ